MINLLKKIKSLRKKSSIKTEDFKNPQIKEKPDDSHYIERAKEILTHAQIESEKKGLRIGEYIRYLIEDTDSTKNSVINTNLRMQISINALKYGFCVVYINDKLIIFTKIQ